MLPGLILTVGLISQSFAGLVSATPRNPDAPRFVNIGDDIVESSTARPVPPASVCAPAVTPPAPAVEPTRVIVEVHVTPVNRVNDDESDGVPADVEAEAGQGIPFDQVYGGITFVPVSVRRGYRPMARPLGFTHSSMHPTAHAVRPPLLPPFQTVQLPPFQTVRLPQLQPVMLPSPVPPHAR